MLGVAEVQYENLTQRQGSALLWFPELKQLPRKGAKKPWRLVAQRCDRAKNNSYALFSNAKFGGTYSVSHAC